MNLEPLPKSIPDFERNHLNGVTFENMGATACAVGVDPTGEHVSHVQATKKLTFQARRAVGERIHFEKPWCCFDFVACYGVWMVERNSDYSAVLKRPWRASLDLVAINTVNRRGTNRSSLRVQTGPCP
jgi:hypothetical protein